MNYVLDCEFNGYKGALITLALVAEDGRSIYIGVTNLSPAETDSWVWNNVMPVIGAALIPIKWGSREENAIAIQNFLAGDTHPHVITDWPDDIKYFCEAIITGPGTMIDVPRISFEVVRVDAYPSSIKEAVQHNAWWDALALESKLAELSADQA